MPFTFSHPALVIPLLRAHQRAQWLSATGLIAGSVAPDFEKFLRLQLASAHSHTFASIFYFSYPVALVLAFVFHGLVRRPLLAHLPAPLHRRLGQYAAFDWFAYCRKHYGGVGISIGLGAALHLVWDVLTHRNALTMRIAPELGHYFRLGPQLLAGFDVVGMMNSAVGGLAIAWALWQLPARTPGPAPAPVAVLRYWALVLGLGAALTAGWVLVTQPRRLVIVITSITAGLVSVVVVSVYTSYVHRHSARRRPSGRETPASRVGG